MIYIMLLTNTYNIINNEDNINKIKQFVNNNENINIFKSLTNIIVAY